MNKSNIYIYIYNPQTIILLQYREGNHVVIRGLDQEKRPRFVDDNGKVTQVSSMANNATKLT